jgi:hypothetical protein
VRCGEEGAAAARRDSRGPQRIRRKVYTPASSRPPTRRL